MWVSSVARSFVQGSLTRARHVHRTHLHRIDGYSLLKQTLVAGEPIKSRPFFASGCEWQLLLYPNGVDADHRGFLSADLKLEYDYFASSTHAMAEYRLSVLDHRGEPAYARDTALRRFDNCPDDGDGYTGIKDFLAAEEMERLAPLVLKSDRLNVLCDVTVLTLQDN